MEMITRMNDLELSQSARKALQVQLGEGPGHEIAMLIQRMASQIDELKRTKVSVTQVIPDKTRPNPVLVALENETF